MNVLAVDDGGTHVKILVTDEVLLGGGNARYLEELPHGCRLGDNAGEFTGGFRLWKRAACAATEKRS